jgi:nicotinamide mononucleotide transporter
LASLLYVWLFYVSKLYGEASVNLFFAVAAVWGWWQWLCGRRADSDEALHVARLDDRGRRLAVAAWIASWVLCSALLGLITDSDVWWADGFVTAGSVVGTVLLGRKFIENWPTWVIVNAASIALFLFKGLTLTAILYAAFLGLAIWGWMGWNKRHVQQGAVSLPS